MALTEIDRNLLQRCLAGEAGAWRDFVDRFIGLFVHVINHTALARNVAIAPQDSDDLCAEIFVALLANDSAVLRHFRAQSALATYVTVVARRIVVHEMAKRQTQGVRERSVGDEVARQRMATSQTPAQRIDDSDEVQQLLHDLPAREAEVVRQFHLEGKSYDEISSGLGIPQNSIGPTLTRARERLRQRNVQP